MSTIWQAQIKIWDLKFFWGEGGTHSALLGKSLLTRNLLNIADSPSRDRNYRPNTNCQYINHWAKLIFF